MSVKVGIIMGSDSDLPVMSEHRTDYANMQRQPRKKVFQ